MIPEETRTRWRKEASNAMLTSALWEYCPDEFLELLDAYEELLRERDLVTRNHEARGPA